MKNKKILNEQSGKEELEKFFRPDCFNENEASIQQVEINGRPIYAIEQLSSDGTRYGYFTLDGKIYTTDANGDLILLQGQKWSCDTAPNIKLPVTNRNAITSPAVKYFNKLNIDLTKPEQVDTLNNIIRQINRFIREGGKGTSIRDFIYFTRELQKDSNYDVYTGITGQKVQQVVAGTTPAEVIQGYLNTTNDTWDLYSDPDPDEVDNFDKIEYKINGVPFVFYKWKGSGRATPTIETGYDPKECIKQLDNYIQAISDPSTMPSDQVLSNYKNSLRKCYGRFWYNSKLNEKDKSGQIKLKLPFGVKMSEVEAKLRELVNRPDKAGLPFTSGITEGKLEPLKDRLRNALLESIENKKKSLIESEIIQSRISVLINENVDYTKKKNQIRLMEEVSEEISELKSNKYNLGLINESFFDWLSSFLGVETQNMKEYIVNFFIKLFGVDPSSNLASSISMAIDNVPESEYGKLFTDCEYTSDIMSKAMVEAMMEQMSSGELESQEVISGMFQNSIMDTLSQDKISISNRMKERIHDFVCEKLNKVHVNMENAKDEIIGKALS